MIAAYLKAFETALQTTETAKPWCETLLAYSRERLQEKPHGDQPRWLAGLDALPSQAATVLLDQDRLSVSGDADLQVVREGLQKLMPWRKGPFDFFGVPLDTEWRSDWKWRRVAPHISSLAGRRVLDVGCGSGYHCWRMAAEGAAFVLGIDPTVLNFFQFQAIKRYTEVPAWFAPLRLEELPPNAQAFDTVFSMGVLYHRRSPFDHLQELWSALKPGGELVLETLVVEGDENTLLLPEDRYASMRNVWFLPSPLMLERWLRRMNFTQVRTVDINRTSVAEQRSTKWMHFLSLADFLSADGTQTIEGYPPPVRATLIATKPA